MGVITDQGVLVLPNYKNGEGVVDLDDYEYSVKNGNIIDSKGTEFNTIATVHTHPSGSGPSIWNGDTYGDLGFAAFKTPYKPIYVLQMKGKDAISFIFSAPNSTKKASDFNYRTFYLTREYPQANISVLLKGEFSLRQYTKNNNFKNLLSK
jgi:hypothetical protein